MKNNYAAIQIIGICLYNIVLIGGFFTLIYFDKVSIGWLFLVMFLITTYKDDSGSKTLLRSVIKTNKEEK